MEIQNDASKKTKPYTYKVLTSNQAPEDLQKYKEILSYFAFPHAYHCRNFIHSGNDTSAIQHWILFIVLNFLLQVDVNIK